MSLLDELNLDPDDVEWRDLSLCQNMEREDFYDNYEADVEIAKAIDQACIVCPVIKECFFAGSQGEWGVWGGVYWNGAGKPDKARNAHKTQEVWDKIHKRVA